jgi:hypothetical protein
MKYLFSTPPASLKTDINAILTRERSERVLIFLRHLHILVVLVAWEVTRSYTTDKLFLRCGRGFASAHVSAPVREQALMAAGVRTPALLGLSTEEVAMKYATDSSPEGSSEFECTRCSRVSVEGFELFATQQIGRWVRCCVGSPVTGTARNSQKSGDRRRGIYPLATYASNCTNAVSSDFLLRRCYFATDSMEIASNKSQVKKISPWHLSEAFHCQLSA